MTLSHQRASKVIPDYVLLAFLASFVIVSVMFVIAAWISDRLG